jgi:orotate phosphoribosyltransferase-like protein
MKDQEIVQRFIHLRSQGWSFSKIMTELNVCRQTVVNWSRKHQFDIQNQRAIQMEALQRQLVATAEDRARLLGERLQKVEAELAKRDLSTVSTARLYTMADALRAQIIRETGPIQFTTPIKEIPDDEYCEQVQDWKP